MPLSEAISAGGRETQRRGTNAIAVVEVTNTVCANYCAAVRRPDGTGYPAVAVPCRAWGPYRWEWLLSASRPSVYTV